MLTLTRKPGQSIVVEFAGRVVEIHTGRIQRGRVQLSIAADREVTIRRGESPPRAA